VNSIDELIGEDVFKKDYDYLHSIFSDKFLYHFKDTITAAERTYYFLKENRKYSENSPVMLYAWNRLSEGEKKAVMKYYRERDIVEILL
jgi:hypothetical protein